MTTRPTQRPASNSEARKRQAAAIFAPVHVRQAEVEGLLADAWEEGWRAAWSPMSMHSLDDSHNPYRADQIAGGGDDE